MIRWVLGVMMCALTFVACSPSASDKCHNVYSSTHYLAEYLVQISMELEKTTDTAQALQNAQAYASRSQKTVDVCVSLINDTLKNMTNEEVLKHHEAYISDPRVKRFLDAQDRFNENATPEQIEALDELLTPFFLLSE